MRTNVKLLKDIMNIRVDECLANIEWLLFLFEGQKSGSPAVREGDKQQGRRGVLSIMMARLVFGGIVGVEKDRVYANLCYWDRGRPARPKQRVHSANN
jgi:hypothetical protein